MAERPESSSPFEEEPSMEWFVGPTDETRRELCEIVNELEENATRSTRNEAELKIGFSSNQFEKNAINILCLEVQSAGVQGEDEEVRRTLMIDFALGDWTRHVYPGSLEPQDADIHILEHTVHEVSSALMKQDDHGVAKAKWLRTAYDFAKKGEDGLTFVPLLLDAAPPVARKEITTYEMSEVSLGNVAKVERASWSLDHRTMGLSLSWLTMVGLDGTEYIYKDEDGKERLTIVEAVDRAKRKDWNEIGKDEALGLNRPTEGSMKRMMEALRAAIDAAPSR